MKIYLRIISDKSRSIEAKEVIHDFNPLKVHKREIF